MAKIDEALDLLMELEHGKIELALHKNKTETGYTYKGIYQTAWPKWAGWNYVLDGISQTDSLKEASIYLEQYPTLQELVIEFYKKNFWDKAKLDHINSQKIAEEIFIFGVNVGMKTSVKRAQKLVGVVADGKIGPKTLKAINEYEVEKFDLEFDEIEKEYYSSLIKKKPYFNIYKKGWFKRADAV